VSLEFLDGGSAEAAGLARLHAEEWRHLYREWNEHTALEEFRRQKTDGALPATLILRRDGRLIGSVSVVRDDCESRTDLNPWLASLYVMPGERACGNGSILVAAALELARRNNVGHLHVFTEAAEKIFLRHGFVPLADAVTNGRAIKILRREI